MFLPSFVFGRNSRRASAISSAALVASVAKVTAAVAAFPSRASIDPQVIAHQTGLDVIDTIAALNVLRRDGKGQFGVEVLNHRGQAIKTFRSVAEIPNRVRDSYGESVLVDPTRLRVVFVRQAQNGP